MKIVLIVSVIMVCTVSTFGQWRLWGTYKGQKTYYQRLKREGDLVTVWTKKGHLLSQLAFDCSNRKVRYMVTIKGENLIETDQEWRTPGPNYGAWVYTKACSQISN